MPRLAYPYIAAHLTLIGWHIMVGQECASGTAPDAPMKVVKSLGLGPAIPGFFMLVVEFEDASVRRLYVSPATCVLEVGEPQELPDIEVPEKPALVVPGR